MPRDMKEYRREYYKANKDKWHESYKRTREAKRKRDREYRACNKLPMRLYMRKWTKEVKITVLTHYGNDKCACVKCGFSDLRALSIDHINAGGKAHKASLKRNGVRFYRWLQKNNYPLEYQTLCMNCQWIKRFENNECNIRVIKA